MNRTCRLSILFFAAVLLPAAGVSAQYRDLVGRLPDGANTVVVLNVEKIHASPLGKEEGWRERHEREFEAGLVVLPPNADRFLMGAKMDFDYMRPIWTATLMDVRYEVSMPKVATWSGGEVDQIEDRNACLLPGDMYVVQFGPQKLGTMTPANRQETSRWVRDVYADSDRQPLSPYLAEAVGYVEDAGTPIILAMDLEGVVSRDYLRARLDELETTKESGLDLEALADVLAGIRGVALGITIRDTVFGKIKVDFRDDVTPLAPIAKPLLLEVLAARGAMIDEFADWKAEARGRRVTLEGQLTASGRRRILSVLDAPEALHHAVRSGQYATSEDSAEKAKVEASRQFFNSVSSLLDDLRSKRSSDELTTWGQVGLWFERYAAKVDRLPVLNVDEELLEFGAYVSSQLREAETAMKGIAPQSRVRQMDVPHYYDVSYGYAGRATRWGAYGAYGWEAQPNSRRRAIERSKVRSQERIRGNTSANLVMQGLQEAVGDIRRRMTQKYNVEF